MKDYLVLRNSIIKLYKENEPASETAVRFLAGFIVFLCIASFMPYGLISLKSLAVAVLGGVIAVFATPSIFIVSAGIILSLCAALSSIEAGVAVAVFAFIGYLMYGRIFPKESLLFVAMVVLYKLRLPFIVPLIAGIYVGPAGIVPVCAAVFAVDFAYIIRQIITALPYSEFTVSGILQDSMTALKYLYEGIMSYSRGIIAVSVVLAVGIIVSWAINTSFTDREKEKGILSNGIILFLGIVICSILSYTAKAVSFGIFGTLISVVISMAVCYVITIFDCVKDYDKTEKVQFQDSHYVYYVKAVPKIEFAENNKPKKSKIKVEDGFRKVKKTSNKKSNDFE